VIVQSNFLIVLQFYKSVRLTPLIDFMLEFIFNRPDFLSLHMEYGWDTMFTVSFFVYSQFSPTGLHRSA